jgi:hypothetical protein
MQLRKLRFLAPLLLALPVLTLPVLARADEQPQQQPDPAKDAQVAKLLEAKKTLHWNTTFGTNKDRYGHAEALVEASADQVAKTASDFGHYRDLHHKFATARIIGKDGDQTDVYMRYPVRLGPITIELYEVMRFGTDHPTGTTHVIEARGIKGDMKRGHTIITVRPVDAKHSILSVDILLVPSLPAPQSYVDEELRDGAFDFVNGLRDKAQGSIGPVVSL